MAPSRSNLTRRATAGLALAPIRTELVERPEKPVCRASSARFEIRSEKSQAK